MIQLQPFTQSDFDTFKSWVNSKEELFQFAGPIFSFPLDDEQLQQYVNMKDKRPFKVVLTSTGENIGHCELNFQDGNNRLSRIFVGRKDLRGQKIGEQIVRQLAALLFENPALEEVDLNTFDWNKAAIRCYEKVGFKINPGQSREMDVYGKKWNKINMVLKRTTFFNSKLDKD